MSGNKKLLDFLLFLLPISVILFVFRSVVFFDRIFSHSDVIHNYFPYFYALSKSDSLIDQSIISGFPIFTSVSTTWFFPINKILFTVFDAFTSFRVLNVSYLIFAYVFTYLYLRKIGFEKETSVLSGLVYIFSGQVMLWSETIIISCYYMFLPLSLYLFEFSLKSNKTYQKIIYNTSVGIVLGLGWLSGHVQWVIYLHVFFVFYWLYFYFFTEIVFDLNKVLRKLLNLLHILTLSLVVGFPQIYSILNFLPVTERADGVPLSVVYASAYTPFHLIHYLIPTFNIPYLPISAAFHNYIGILPIFILVFSLFFSRKLIREDRVYRFFFYVFIFCFVASIKYSPLTFLIHQLPFFNTFREFVRIMYIGDFAIAICVSIFIDYLQKNRKELEPSIKKFLMWGRRVFVYLLMPIVVVFTIIQIFFVEKLEEFLHVYFLKNLFSSRIGGFAIDHYYSLINRYVAESISQFSLINYNVFVFVIFSILTYYLLKRIEFFENKTFLYICIVLISVNFLFVYKERVYGVTRDEYLNPPNTANYILSKNSKRDFRIITPFADIALFNESIACNFENLGGWDMSHKEFIYQKELMEPNSNIIYGVDSAEGYEPYMPDRMSNIIGYLGSRWAVADSPSLSGEKTSIKEKIDKLKGRLNIFRSLNIKYLISPFEIVDPSLKEVYLEKVGKCGSEIRIYELNNYWPRYFVSNNISIISNKENSESFMDRISQMKTPEIMLENSDVILNKSKSFFKRVDHSGVGDNIIMEFENDQPGYLLIGNSWMPDWHVLVDGKESQIIKANYVYMAVYVDSGHHVVKLYYEEKKPLDFLYEKINTFIK